MPKHACLMMLFACVAFLFAVSAVSPCCMRRRSTDKLVIKERAARRAHACGIVIGRLPDFAPSRG